MKPSCKPLYLCLVFSLVSFCNANLYAQEVPDAVVESSLRAIGSRNDIARIRNIRALADCTGPNGSYTTEIYSAKGSRLIFRQVRSGNVYHGQTNGTVYWTKDEKADEFALADRRAAFAWRTHDYQALAIEFSQRFHELAFAGYEEFAGRNAVKLSATDELGKPAFFFFARDSKLMLGFVIQNPFAAQTELIRSVYDEWKQIGRVRLPSKVTVTDKSGDFVLNFRDISLNRIDEKVFAVPGTVVAMNELLELHHRARAAHFNRDAKLLVADFSDEFTNIRGGKIQKPSRAESLASFQNYFDNSTFLEWDDITPPVIKVSNDATMAYVIVHKKVRLSRNNDAGVPREETAIYAWMATYRKIGGKWQLTTVTSTNTPEQ